MFTGNWDEVPSKVRLLRSAKTLWALLGFDDVSTAWVAKDAKTSESQLVKHYGTKEGLLISVFDEGWEKVNTKLSESFKDVAEVGANLQSVVEISLSVIKEDPEFMRLIFLEGHHLHQIRSLQETRGYGFFCSAIHQSINQAQDRGDIPMSVPAIVLQAAIVGIIESSVRDMVLAGQAGYTADSTILDMARVVIGFTNTLRTRDQ